MNMQPPFQAANMAHLIDAYVIMQSQRFSNTKSGVEPPCGLAYNERLFNSADKAAKVSLRTIGVTA